MSKQKLNYDLILSSNKFASLLYKQISNDNKNKNLIFSPLSIYIALSMCAAGASGSNEVEMKSLLYKDVPPSVSIDAIMQQFINTFYNHKDISIANRSWVRTGYNLLPQYVQTIKSVYQSQITNANMDDATLEEVNGWVNAQTHGKIPKVLENLSENCALLLVNAIYFKAQWLNKFDKRQTVQAPFILNKNSKKQVNMMNQYGVSLSFTKAAEYTAIALPYEKNEFSMIFVRPTTALDLQAIESKYFSSVANASKFLSTEKFNHADFSVVSVPRFKADFSVLLNDTLQSIGMKQMFVPGGLLKTSGSEDLFVNRVIHKAVIEVDETGTVAAAVTAVEEDDEEELDDTEPEKFVLDRPFMYFIRHNASGLIAFMGSIYDPKE